MRIWNLLGFLYCKPIKINLANKTPKIPCPGLILKVTM